jgi:hypothetical protein
VLLSPDRRLVRAPQCWAQCVAWCTNSVPVLDGASWSDRCVSSTAPSAGPSAGECWSGSSHSAALPAPSLSSAETLPRCVAPSSPAPTGSWIVAPVRRLVARRAQCPFPAPVRCWLTADQLLSSSLQLPSPSCSPSASPSSLPSSSLGYSECRAQC